MFDTVIIGGGIAGVAAGQYLTMNGVENFVLLESSEKIGGRVCTIEFGGSVFSAGPGWIHGMEGNPIYEIMTNIGIKLEMCQYENAYFVWDMINGKEISNTFKDTCLLLEETFDKVSMKLNDIELDPSESIEDVLRKHSKVYPLKNDIEKVAMFICKEIYMGAPLIGVSAMVDFLLDDIYTTSEEHNINFRIIDPLGGMKMIEYLSKDFQTKIKTKNKVERIIWNENTHEAEVITNEGSSFICKNVIITLPSSFLAKNAIIFEPRIPAAKELAWRYVPSVNYCRIFAKFPHCFWPDKEWLLCVNKDVDPFSELILWQNCSKQNLCSRESNILICHFTFGYNNKECNKFNVDKDSLSKLVEESMQNMFPSTYCKPNDVKFISYWDSETCSGSYSVAAPGLDQSMIISLTQSIGPLHFAGESVSVKLLGTMQAAYITGRNAAQFTLNSV